MNSAMWFGLGVVVGSAITGVASVYIVKYYLSLLADEIKELHEKAIALEEEINAMDEEQAGSSL